MLDATLRWDRELSDDEQQTVAFARAVLHAPPWLLIDEVLDSFEEETRRRIADVLAEDLEHTAIIHIGRAEAGDSFFSRVLHLIKDPAIRQLAAGVPQPAPGDGDGARGATAGSAAP